MALNPANSPNPYPTPELDFNNLSNPVVGGAGAEIKFEHTLIAKIGRVFLPFIGVNDNKISDVYNWYRFRNELNRSPYVDILFTTMSNDLFYHLYDSDVEYMWIFHDYFAKREMYYENLQEYRENKICIVQLNNMWKVKSMNILTVS